MLRLTVFEFLFRGIPEAFILVFAMIALSNIKLNTERYIISSLLLGTYVYFVRLLPIIYGAHTILDIFVMIVLMCVINKADIRLAIRVSLISTIILYIFEGLNVLLLNVIFKDKLEAVMSNTIFKVMYGMPSLICFAGITIIYYMRKKDV